MRPEGRLWWLGGWARTRDFYVGSREGTAFEAGQMGWTRTEENVMQAVGLEWLLAWGRWAEVLIFLGIGAVWDVRKRQISLVITVLAGIAGLLCAWSDDACSVSIFLWQLVPGLFLLLAAILSRGRAGMGDALTMLSCAGFLRGNEGLALLAAASLTAAVWSGQLLARGSKGSAQIPFVPFLLAGATAVLVLEVCA